MMSVVSLSASDMKCGASMKQGVVQKPACCEYEKKMGKPACCKDKTSKMKEACCEAKTPSNSSMKCGAAKCGKSMDKPEKKVPKQTMKCGTGKCA